MPNYYETCYVTQATSTSSSGDTDELFGYSALRVQSNSATDYTTWNRVVAQYQGVSYVNNCILQYGYVNNIGQISFNVQAKIYVHICAIPEVIGLQLVADINGKRYNITKNLRYDEFELGAENCAIITIKGEVTRLMKADNPEAWQAWVDSGQSEDAWLAWNIDVDEVNALRSAGSIERYKVEKTERERQLIESEKKRQEEITIKQQLKEKASEKAKQLLKEVIGEVDFSEYQKTGIIAVTTKSGKHYRLRKDGFARNIDVYEKGQYKHRLCAHLADQNIPIEDNLVAQVLMLRHAEEDFLKMANVS